MALVKEYGGDVVVPPMSVGPLGHMAVVMSAGGEAVGFWQPGEFGGHDLPLTEGTSVWFEVMSTDFAADARFYRAVAGWDVVPMGEDGGRTPTPPAPRTAAPPATPRTSAASAPPPACATLSSGCRPACRATGASTSRCRTWTRPCR